MIIIFLLGVIVAQRPQIINENEVRSCENFIVEVT